MIPPCNWHRLSEKARSATVSVLENSTVNGHLSENITLFLGRFYAKSLGFVFRTDKNYFFKANI